MAALAGTFMDDPFPDPDIAKCEADLERLQYTEYRNPDQWREVERCKRVLETHLARMRKQAAA